MKSRMILLFAAHTRGTKRGDAEPGWRLCTLTRKLSQPESRRADIATQVGSVMHVADVDWVCVERPESGKAGDYIFHPAHTDRAVKVGLRKPTPILPRTDGREFGDVRLRLEKNGFRTVLSRAYDNKPGPYRPGH